MGAQTSDSEDLGTSSPQRLIRWAIPAYNESASIEDLLARIAAVSEAQRWRWEAIVVDDGSADATAEIVERVAASGIPARLVRNPSNLGLGFTIRRALQTAIADEHYRCNDDDVIITLDADLTQDPRYAPHMVRCIDDGFDVVIASRYRPGSHIEGLSWVRRMLSSVASVLITLLRPIRNVRDYSCGFRAYRASVIAEGFKHYGDDFVSERGFACMLEIAERLRDRAHFTEIPFVLRYDQKRKESAIKILPTIGAYARVVAKVATTGRKPVPVATLVVAFSAILCSSLAQVVLRVGVRDIGDATVAETLGRALVSPVVLGGLALYAVSSALWLGVLSRMALAVAYPLGASGYVLVVLLASFTGEAVPPLRWVGVGLIMIGILLVGWLGVVPVKGGIK